MAPQLKWGTCGLSWHRWRHARRCTSSSAPIQTYTHTRRETRKAVFSVCSLISQVSTRFRETGHKHTRWQLAADRLVWPVFKGDKYIWCWMCFAKPAWYVVVPPAWPGRVSTFISRWQAKLAVSATHVSAASSEWLGTILRPAKIFAAHWFVSAAFCVPGATYKRKAGIGSEHNAH